MFTNLSKRGGIEWDTIVTFILILILLFVLLVYTGVLKDGMEQIASRLTAFFGGE